MNKRFFVYILSNRRRGVLYVGVTNDLIRRLSEHKAKLVPGFIKAYGVVLRAVLQRAARQGETAVLRLRRAAEIERTAVDRGRTADVAERAGARNLQRAGIHGR